MRRLKNGTIVFPDHPEFTPNLTPKEMFMQGAFGGTYWRPIFSGVNKRWYRGEYKRYKCLKGVDVDLLAGTACDTSINLYGVRSGTSLRYWESKGWIHKQDPYGWVQWYCEFYDGRRSDDDERQIGRWLAFAGPKGRFLLRLLGMIVDRGATYSDVRVSPVIRQGLHQWAKVVTSNDVAAFKRRL